MAPRQNGQIQRSPVVRTDQAGSWSSFFRTRGARVLLPRTPPIPAPKEGRPIVRTGREGVVMGW